MLIHSRMMPFLSARLRSMTSCMALLGTTLHAVGAILRLPKAQLRWFVQTANVGRLTWLELHSKNSRLNIQLRFIGISFWFFHNRYRSKISVYDNSDQAFFVLLGDAGRELTGKPASELVRSFFEVNFHPTMFCNVLTWLYCTWLSG